MATSRDPADARKIDWRFYLPVCLAIIFGALIIAIVEGSPALRLILRGWADAALVLGGALIGLTGIVLEEIYRGGPEREHVAQEREADRQRHREERRLDSPSTANCRPSFAKRNRAPNAYRPSSS